MTAVTGLPLPMTIIAGYLGAGKTTLVNAILASDHGLRITVLVNDFGEIALDDSLIENRQGETIALANGCVCCSIGGDLWDAINRVLAMKPLPDRLVIETSGVADPAKIHRIALADPDLADAGIVSVADAVNLESLLADPVLGVTVRQQLQSASLVVVTKTDLIGDDALTNAMARVAEIAPGRAIALSVPGNTPVQIALDAPPAGDTTSIPATAGPLRILPADHDMTYATWVWSGDAAVDPDRLKAFLATDDCGVWRMKGIVKGKDGKWLTVHRAGSQVELSETGDDAGLARIVAIGAAERFCGEEIERRWQGILVQP